MSRLNDEELIEIDMAPKDERPALKAWFESCKKRGVKWHSKMEMMKAKRNFFLGFNAAKENQNGN